MAELGAYALGLLDETQARAVEQHIAGCAPCRREWEGLREMSDLLGEMPPEVFLDGPPDGDLVLARTLRQVRGEVTAKRRRRIMTGVAAAAVVVAAVLGGGVLVGRATAPATTATQAAGALVLEGTGGSGATLRAAVTPAAEWVRLEVTVAGVPAGEHCRLLVVGKDGRREIAGSWTVGAKGEAGITLAGAADVPLADVASVSVESVTGKVYVSAVT